LPKQLITSSSSKNNDNDANIDTILSVKDFRTKCISSNNQNYQCFRPAGLAFYNGILYVSSDSTGEIVRVLKGTAEAVQRDPTGNSSFKVTSSIVLVLMLFLIFLIF
jgi:hypothetical protein